MMSTERLSIKKRFSLHWKHNLFVIYMGTIHFSFDSIGMSLHLYFAALHHFIYTIESNFWNGFSSLFYRHGFRLCDKRREQWIIIEYCNYIGARDKSTYFDNNFRVTLSYMLHNINFESYSVLPNWIN